MSDVEQQFQSWAERETLRSEARRLQSQAQQLERAELITYLLVIGWVTAMFVGFQMTWVSASLAGLITLWSFGGGAFIIWQIRLRQRIIRQRLAIIRQTLEPGQDSPSPR